MGSIARFLRPPSHYRKSHVVSPGRKNTSSSLSERSRIPSFVKVRVSRYCLKTHQKCNSLKTFSAEASANGLVFLPAC